MQLLRHNAAQLCSALRAVGIEYETLTTKEIEKWRGGTVIVKRWLYEFGADTNRIDFIRSTSIALQ